MAWRWFLSGTVRQASDLSNRVAKIVQAQRDLLSEQALEALGEAQSKLKAAISEGGDREEILRRGNALEETANKWLRPYPKAAVRENVDVILVALVVALGIRTFFLQPMAIPTGSMQPTLYGITHQDLRKEPNARIPGGLTRLFHFLARGISYHQVKAEEDGVFQGFKPPRAVFGLFKKQELVVGTRTYSLWFPPDEIVEKTGLRRGDTFRAGEDIIKLKVVGGDRLFVDRFTYNFRRPKRGEIIIFASQGIPKLQQDTHYIKRLAGLPGETIRIGNHRRVVVDGKSLDASARGFEGLYSFNGPPRESHYSGHVNGLTALEAGRPLMSPDFLFPHGEAEFKVRSGHFFVLGDNTMNSFDSRYWGDFPAEKAVGRCWFVFWPISPRFGWGVR